MVIGLASMVSCLRPIVVICGNSSCGVGNNLFSIEPTVLSACFLCVFVIAIVIYTEPGIIDVYGRLS